MTNYILTLDAGTTGVQSSLFDVNYFSMIGNVKIPFEQIFPSPGLVEHNPNEIWQAILQAIEETCTQALQIDSTFTKNKIVAIGITNQRETCLGWNLKTHASPFNALVWQDKRTTDVCNKMKEDKKLEQQIKLKTGLLCDPYFSATKMQWLLENNDTLKNWAQKKELALGTIDSFLVWKLTGHTQFVTDHTNASRTLLYELETGSYDNELLDIFRIPKHTLAEIKDSIELFGHTKNCSVLPNGIPICCILGDQQAALFGQRCTTAGQIKITYGTGAFILMNTGDTPFYSNKKLLTTVAFSKQNKRTFALEGSAFIAGAAVQFLRDNFKWFNNSFECEKLALAGPRDENLLFVPALSGLGAPYWNPKAKAVLFGMNRGTQKGQIIRAVLESIALQNVELVKLMSEESKQELKHVGVDGGAAENDFLMQFQSDCLQKKLLRPVNLQTTSLGVAFGSYEYLNKSPPTENPLKSGKEFSPELSKEEATQMNQKWQKACQCVNDFYN